MQTKKQLIAQIINNFQAFKNKMQAQFLDGDKHTLTLSQWCVLELIAVHKNASVKDIAQKLGVSQSAATQLVGELVHRGFITRKTNKHDKRELDLAVSKKGKTYAVTMKKRHEAIAHTLFGALSDAELKQYVKLQYKLLSKI